MNKKTFIMVIAFILLSFISVACKKEQAVTQLTDDEVFQLYNKAREAYEWFDLKTIPHDSERYIEVNGERYFEVVQPGMNSKKALVDYLNGLFTGDITESLMTTSSGRFVEKDDKLYVLPADRGTDILKGKESYRLERISDKQLMITVTVEVYDDPDAKNVVGYEEHDFYLEFSDNRWRFKNFELVR